MKAKKRHCRDPKCVAGPNGVRHVYRYGITAERGSGSGMQVCASRDYRHVAHNLEPWHPDAPHYDEEGQPEFHTKKEIVEFAAKTGKVYR